MALARPIVASATRALKATPPEHDVFSYTPDVVESLVAAVRTSLTESVDTRTERAREEARTHTWDARASRIVSFIKRGA